MEGLKMWLSRVGESWDGEYGEARVEVLCSNSAIFSMSSSSCISLSTLDADDVGASLELTLPA
jgi:hypothetical protein